jgi:DNA replication initiation complex subunit (GINS family)
MDFDHAFYSFRVWMKTKTSFQNAEKVKKTALTDEKIALLEALPKLTKEEKAELKALKEKEAKSREEGQPKDTPQPKPKRRKKAKASAKRGKTKYDGIEGNGRSEDWPMQNIPKIVLDQHY